MSYGGGGNRVPIWCVMNGGSSVAFEPVPQTFAHLEKNARRYGNIEAVCSGVGDKHEEQKIAVKRTNMGASTISSKGSITVVLHKIDDLTDRYGIPTFIKMDLEGYEMPALRGAANTIKQYTCV